MSIEMEKRAFTLLEILVVVAIVATLVALVFPLISISRQRSYAADNISKLRQLGQASTLYEQAQGDYPLRAVHLVESDLVPKELCASALDNRASGMANAYIREQGANPLAGNLASEAPFKVSFVGVGELHPNLEYFNKDIKDKAGAGWLIDATSTTEGLVKSFAFREGKYRRLLLDGSVVTKSMHDVNCAGSPCKASRALFVDVARWQGGNR
jgi:prepilin-type N-terminal cleavage/methylation domain-containing protein